MKGRCDKFCLGNCHQPFKSAWVAPYEEVPLMVPETGPHYCTRLHTPRRSLDFVYSVEPATIRGLRPYPHHALVLQTAPRPQESLSSTMESLVAAGIECWDGPKILASDGPRDDSVLRVTGPSWFRFESPNSGGSAAAFVRMLRYALALDPHLEYLTFLEDDIVLCKNALRYMARITVPTDVAFVTWFTYDYDFSYPKREDDFRHPSTYPTSVLAVRPARFFILTQVCTFTRDTVDRLLNCPHVTDEWPKKDSHDEMIAWALGDALYAVHFPILVQHTGGLNSAVLFARGRAAEDEKDPQAGTRTSPYFKGVNFDALSMLCGISPASK